MSHLLWYQCQFHFQAFVMLLASIWSMLHPEFSLELQWFSYWSLWVCSACEQLGTKSATFCRIPFRIKICLFPVLSSLTFPYILYSQETPPRLQLLLILMLRKQRFSLSFSFLHYSLVLCIGVFFGNKAAREKKEKKITRTISFFDQHSPFT